MGSLPLVSVIVPCFNDARYLEDAVGSVLAQAYPAVEVVIVDDGSTDESRVIAQAIAARNPAVRVVCQPHGGLASARNRGVDESRGDFLQFLDADDALEPRKIERQVAFLEEHPEIGITYSDVRYFTTDSPNLRRLTLRGYDTASRGDTSWVETLALALRPTLEKALDQNIFPVNCALIRRTEVARVGKWNERLAAMEDWEYWLRCAALGVKFAYHSEPGMMALVRARPGSLSTDRVRMARFTIEARISVGKFLPSPSARLTNFRHGQRQSCALGSQGHMGRVVRLAWSNRCLGVFLEATGLRSLTNLAVTSLWVAWSRVRWIVPSGIRRALRRSLTRRSPDGATDAVAGGPDDSARGSA